MLTPIVQVYRFSEQGGTYESFTVVSMMLGEATCHGLDRPITLKQARRFVKTLRNNGVHTLRFIRNGRVKEHRIKHDYDSTAQRR